MQLPASDAAPTASLDRRLRRSAKMREHALRLGRVGMGREPLLEDRARLALAPARLERARKEEARLGGVVVNRPCLGRSSRLTLPFSPCS